MCSLYTGLVMWLMHTMEEIYAVPEWVSRYCTSCLHKTFEQTLWGPPLLLMLFMLPPPYVHASIWYFCNIYIYINRWCIPDFAATLALMKMYPIIFEIRWEGKYFSYPVCLALFQSHVLMGRGGFWWTEEKMVYASMIYEWLNQLEPLCSSRGWKTSRAPGSIRRPRLAFDIFFFSIRFQLIFYMVGIH